MYNARPFDRSRVILRVGMVIALAVGSGSAHAEVLARAWVPNGVVPQGEVRLVSRNGEAVVQTVLHTRFERRVERTISGKEQQNWDDHADALAYISTLKEAVGEYVRRKAASAEAVALVIDYVAGPETARVDFSFSRVRREKNGLRVSSAVVWQGLALSTDYVRRNQELILADAFGDGAKKAIRELHSIRPMLPEERVDE